MPRAPGSCPRAARAPTRRSRVCRRPVARSRSEGGGRGSGEFERCALVGGWVGEPQPKGAVPEPDGYLYFAACAPLIFEERWWSAQSDRKGLLGGREAKNGMIPFWIDSLTSLPTLLFLGSPACGTPQPQPPPPVPRMRICLCTQVHVTLGLVRWLGGKESTCQCSRHGFSL